jgi:hypothetical protein
MWCSDGSDTLMVVRLFVQLRCFGVSLLAGGCDVISCDSLVYLYGLEWRALGFYLHVSGLPRLVHPHTNAEC